METLSKIIFLLGRNKFKRLLFLLFLLTISVVLETASLLMIFPLMQIVSHPDYVESQEAIGFFYNLFNFSSYTSFLIAVCITLSVLLTLINIYRIWINNKRIQFLSEEQMLLSSHMICAYFSQPYTYWVNKNKGDLIKNINSDIDIVFNKILVRAIAFCLDLLLVFLILIILFIINPLMTFSIVVVGCLFGLIYLSFQIKNRKLFDAQRFHRTEMVNSLKQIAQAGAEINSAGKESYFFGVFAESMKRYLENSNSYKFFLQIPSVFNQSIRPYGILALLLFTLISDYDFRSLLPLLIVFGIGLMRIIPSFNRLLKSYFEIKLFKPSLAVIYNELTHLEKAKSGRNHRARRRLPNYRSVEEKDRAHFTEDFHLITVRDVYHTYKGAKPVTLKTELLSIPSGSTVAITGAPGSGKTIIGEIIAGLIQPDGGRVLVDNIDIKYMINGWRNRVGYVSKSVTLLPDTIRKNVAFGISDRQINDIRVWRVLEMAGLKSFVKGLPNNLGTHIARKADPLVSAETDPSGDDTEILFKNEQAPALELTSIQIRQLGIARALYHNPAVVILDETTAGFDDETEEAILESMCNKTVILITRKPRTMKYCDYIYEVIDGETMTKGSRHSI
jgi:ATP-binding cassette, subfamily B, bacterial PglK